jgi:hypothetical protein
MTPLEASQAWIKFPALPLEGLASATSCSLPIGIPTRAGVFWSPVVRLADLYGVPDDEIDRIASE